MFAGQHVFNVLKRLICNLTQTYGARKVDSFHLLDIKNAQKSCTYHINMQQSLTNLVLRLQFCSLCQRKVTLPESEDKLPGRIYPLHKPASYLDPSVVDQDMGH